MAEIKPTLLPLGDRALLLRFGEVLTDEANRSAIAYGEAIKSAKLSGITEIVSNLVSVCVHYDPLQVAFDDLAGHIRLLSSTHTPTNASSARHTIKVSFGGAHGPDLEQVASDLNMDAKSFIARHNAAPLRVLATGFAPGFVYCGLHPDDLHVLRRQKVRASVPPGTILFAAGQTAITATTIPTGWHVIGRTEFRNFEPQSNPPTKLAAGDQIKLEAVS